MASSLQWEGIPLWKDEGTKAYVGPFCGVVHIPAYTSGQGRSKTSMAAAQVLSDNHIPKSTRVARAPFPMYEPVTSLLTVDSHCFNNGKVRQNMYMYRFVV